MPSKSIDADQVVALGAAIHGSFLAQNGSPVLVVDVTPNDIGIVIDGGPYQVIMPRHRPVPASATREFTTDGQTRIPIEIFQGRSAQADENELFGRAIIDGAPSALTGEVRIEVTFDVSADGLVSVSARDPKTGASRALTMVAPSSTSVEEVLRMMDEEMDDIWTPPEEDA